MSTSEITSGSPEPLQYIRLQDHPVESVNPLFDRQLVAGERTMLARIVLSAGCVVPLHSHENEQITYVLDGALKFHIQGREIIVRSGEVLVIPSHVPHTAEALEDTVDLDIFTPPRVDWLQGTDQYLRDQHRK